MLLWAALIAITLRYLVPHWRRQPPDSVVGAAARPLSGIEPTGPHGTWTRRDHLRGAGTAAMTSAALLGVGMLASTGAQGIGDTTTPGMILTGIGFGAAVGTAMAAVWTIVCLCKAAFIRRVDPTSQSRRD